MAVLMTLEFEASLDEYDKVNEKLGTVSFAVSVARSVNGRTCASHRVWFPTMSP